MHTAQLSLASVKSRLVLPFWYRLTRVVPDKAPLSGVCVHVYPFACVCHAFSADNLGADASPKVSQQPYKKAPAPPPPPPSTNQHAASSQLAVKRTASHVRSQSGNERPSVPPPAPPRRPDKPGGAGKAEAERLSGDTWNTADTVTAGSVDDSTAAVLGDDVEHSDLSASYDAAGSRSVDASVVSDLAELSWSSELDQSGSSAGSGGQPAKDDIRRMTAQLKAQWWQNSPGDRAAATAASKLTPEISGRFNPRTSPTEQPAPLPLDDSRPDDSSEISVNHVERKSDEFDEKPETMDSEPDATDADDLTGNLDTGGGRLDTAEIDIQVTAPDAVVVTDKLPVRTDLRSAGESPTTDAGDDFDADLRREDAGSNKSQSDVSTDDVSRDRGSGDVSGKQDVDVHDMELSVVDPGAHADAARVKEVGVKSEVHLPKPEGGRELEGGGGKSEVQLPKPGGGRDSAMRVDVRLAADATAVSTGPTSPAPPTKPKPLKTPPVRPPAIGSASPETGPLPPTRPPPLSGPSEVARSPEPCRHPPARPPPCTSSDAHPPAVTPRKPGEVVPASAAAESWCPPPPTARRKPSVDGARPADGPAEVQAAAPDGGGGTRSRTTLERVRPEKPPPPLPRNRTSDPPATVESVPAAAAGGVDPSADTVFVDDADVAAAHDEDTHL